MLVTSYTKNMTLWLLFQNTFILRKPGIAKFAHIIWFLLKQSLKTQKKLYWQMQSISVFLDIEKFTDFQWKNADVSRNQKGCGVFLVLLHLSAVPKIPILDRVDSLKEYPLLSLKIFYFQFYLHRLTNLE